MKNNITYYPHRTDAHDHWKFKTLRRKYGWAGDGKFWALNNMIADAANCTLNITDEDHRASMAADLDFDPEEFEAFIRYLISPCKIVKHTSAGLQTEYTQAALAEVAKKRKYQAKWKKEKTTTTPTTPPPAPTPQTPTPLPQNPGVEPDTPTKSVVDLPTSDTAPKIDIQVPPRKKAAIPAKHADEAIPGWQRIVDCWFDFNLDKYGAKPSFKGADPKLLRLICENLEKRVIAAAGAWNEQTAPEVFQHFLTLAFNEKWLKTNFLLSNLERQFDKVILNAKSLQNGAALQPTGAAVNAQSAFDKIDAMYS